MQRRYARRRKAAGTAFLPGSQFVFRPTHDNMHLVRPVAVEIDLDSTIKTAMELFFAANALKNLAMDFDS